MNKIYKYRKDNHLCVNCGDKAEDGSTRCIRCMQIERVKAHERYINLSPEEKHEKYLRQKRWRFNHPEKIEEYAKRKTEYNRRYKNKYEW